MTGAAGFYAMAALAVLSALGVILSRNLVHAVLFMVGNFLVTAGLYLLLQAPFIAMAQVVVYAGAIMVLFLFVVMLLGRQEAPLAEPITGQRVLGVLGVVLLFAVLLFAVGEGVPAAPPDGWVPATGLPDGFGSPGAIGDTLFRVHVLGFEIISVLLLIAILGAVIIAKAVPRDGADSDAAEHAQVGLESAGADRAQVGPESAGADQEEAG